MIPWRRTDGARHTEAADAPAGSTIKFKIEIAGRRHLDSKQTIDFGDGQPPSSVAPPSDGGGHNYERPGVRTYPGQRDASPTRRERHDSARRAFRSPREALKREEGAARTERSFSQVREPSPLGPLN